MNSTNIDIERYTTMIEEREELLKDEMARAMLGDGGIEAIQHFIDHYKGKIEELKNR